MNTVARWSLAAVTVLVAVLAVAELAGSGWRHSWRWGMAAVILAGFLGLDARSRRRQAMSSAAVGEWSQDRVRDLVFPRNERSEDRSAQTPVSRIEQVKTLRSTDGRLSLVDAVRLVDDASGVRAAERGGQQ